MYFTDRSLIINKTKYNNTRSLSSWTIFQQQKGLSSFGHQIPNSWMIWWKVKHDLDQSSESSSHAADSNAFQLIRSKVDREINQETWLAFICRCEASNVGSKISKKIQESSYSNMRNTLYEGRYTACLTYTGSHANLLAATNWSRSPLRQEVGRLRTCPICYACKLVVSVWYSPGNRISHPEWQ